LQWFINDRALAFHPRIQKVLEICVSEEIIERFTPLKASEKNTLGSTSTAFPLKTNTADKAGMGWLCFRLPGILNPGRIEELKQRPAGTGKFKDYLEQQHACRVSDSVFDIVT